LKPKENNEIAALARFAPRHALRQLFATRRPVFPNEWGEGVKGGCVMHYSNE
jgi:hypothetical protein